MHLETLETNKIFVIHNFLNPEECDRFIATSEGIGYLDAPMTTSRGFVMRKDIRDNERVIHDDPAQAADLWERARQFIPATQGSWDAVGLNERFRYYRYDPGQKFAPHLDGYFRRPTGEQSLRTFMIYLNEGCEGGETLFYQHDPIFNPGASEPALRIRPERGKALVFIHDILHEGAPVVKGRKYVLRTDIMYRLKAAVV